MLSCNDLRRQGLKMMLINLNERKRKYLKQCLHFLAWFRRESLSQLI